MKGGNCLLAALAMFPPLPPHVVPGQSPGITSDFE
jgi:hypothetical protein